jgi:hypothetical protein
MKATRGWTLALLMLAACSDTLTGPGGKLPHRPLAAIPPTNNTVCNKFWVGATNGNWTDPARWNPAGVPTATSSVCINVAGTYTVTLAGTSDPLNPTVANVLALDVGGAGAAPTLVTTNGYTTINVVEGIVVQPNAILRYNNSQQGIITAGQTVTNLGSLEAIAPCGSGCAKDDHLNADVINNGVMLINGGNLTLPKVDGGYQNTGTVNVQSGTMLIPATAGNAVFNQDAGLITGSSNFPTFTIRSGTFSMNGGKLRTRNGTTNLKPIVIVDGANLALGASATDSITIGVYGSSSASANITGNVGDLTTLWLAGPSDLNPGTTTFLDASPVNNGRIRVGSIDVGDAALTIAGTGRLTNADSLYDVGISGGFTYHFTLELTNNGTQTVHNTWALEKAGGTYYNSGLITGSGTQQVIGNTYVSTATGTVSPTNTSGTPRFLVDGGRLIGVGTSGQITLVNGGTVEPGMSPGILNARNLAAPAGTSLKIELGGTQVGTEYDQLNLAGAPTAQGSVDISEINGFLSGVCGQVFEVFTFNSATSFPNYNGLNPAPTRALRVFQQQTTGLDKTILYGYDPTVKVSVAPNPVAIAEGGPGVQYAVCLDGAPAVGSGQTVTVTPAPNAQITVSPASVTFNNTNWRAPQFFTVTAVDDNVVEGNHSGTATHASASNIAAYNGVVIASLTANITDNDAPPLTPTTTSVGSSANPSTFGQSVTFTATVTSGAGTPDGTVQFSIDGSNVGSAVTLNAAGQAQFSTSSLAVGNHTVQAAYGGSATFSGSNGALTGGQTVDPVSTSTALSSDHNPSNVGQTVTFTAMVSSTGGVPTGTVQFTIDGGNAGGPVALAGGQATHQTSSLTSGTHTVTATYSGATNFSGSSGSLSGGQIVNLNATTTSVGSSQNPSTFGQSVTFTATVSSGAGTPSGNVQFTIDGNPAATVALAGGQATFQTSSLAVGNHAVSATYTGNATHAGSTGSLGGGQDINQAPTTTGVSSSANPSVSGQSVTFTATVSSGVGTPTGSVQFDIDGSNVGSTALDASGQAMFTTSTLGVGNHTVQASYLGGGNFAFSTGSLSGGQQVNAPAPSSTATAVSSSLNPSNVGQSVTFTATVSSGGGTPTGSVQFAIDGSNFGGAVTLVGGQATLVTASLAAGIHPVTATYSGDAGFSGSNGSLGGGQVVQPAGTVTTVSSSANPSIPGQHVTFTATVSSGAGIPAGTIQFDVDGISVATVALNASGQATFTTSTLTLGNHPVLASYSGNANFSPSGGALGGGQTVTAAPTTTTVASIVTATPQYSDQVTLRATVTPHLIGASELTGTVYFYIGAASVSCTPTAPTGSVGSDAIAAADDGVGQIDYQALYIPGAHTVTACFYSSNALFSNSGDTEAIALGKEDAAVAPGATYDNAFEATGATPSASFTLSFVLQEKNPEPDVNAGAMPGDIDHAGLTVTLVAVGSGANNQTVVCSPSATIVTAPSYTDAKTFTCGFTGVAVDAYEVDAHVTGNYYTGGLVDALTVYDANAGFATGGGKFIYPGSTDVVNFSLSVNFTGKGRTTPRGNFIAIRHKANGDLCRAKSNAIDAPAISGNSASFSGKGNYVCTRPDGTTYDGIGNKTILGWMQDNGEPGSSATTPDRAWIRMVVPNSALAMAVPASANAKPLVAGNVHVPHQ